MLGGAVALGEAMYTLARPDRAPAHGAVLVHKLRSADLADAPPLSEAVDQLLGMLAGRVPVFHTAIVERTFLGRELRRRRVRLPAEADTEALGRLWLRERDGVAPAGLPLARLCSLLGIPGGDAPPRPRRRADDRQGLHRPRRPPRGAQPSDGRLAA